MKLNKIFLSMAALAFLGAMTVGCSGDDLAAETPQLPNTTNGTVVTKVTVSLDEHASTRMLDPTGLKTFEEGDKIAVIYTNTAGVTVKAESDPLQATDLHDAKKTGSFSVTLTNPQANTPVRYIYPAAMAADDVSATTPDNDATIKWSNLASQYGDFAFISEHVDLAVFDGTMTAQSNLPEPAPLKNQLTVGAFTIENSGGTDVTNTITKLTISDGTNTYTVSRTAADGPIYVAMIPMDNKTVTVSVTSNNNKYSDKSVSATTLAKNKIYPINVSLTARYPLAVTAASVSSDDIGSVIGADGNIYLNAAAAAAASTTAQAVIAYVGRVPNYFDKFLAIAMEDADGNQQTWADAHTKVGSFAASHAITIGSTEYKTNAIGVTYYDEVPVGIGMGMYTATRTSGVVKGWRMPCVTDWRYIFDGLGRQKAGLTLTAKSGSTVYSDNVTPTDPAGIFSQMFYGDASNASSLRAAINEACGNTALQSDIYWSSSKDEYDSGNVWLYVFSTSEFYSSYMDGVYYTRAVFAY